MTGDSRSRQRALGSALLILWTLVIPGFQTASADVLPGPDLEGFDYVKGTWGEPLTLGDVWLAEPDQTRGTLSLYYARGGEYWTSEGERREGTLYRRFTGMLSFQTSLGRAIDFNLRIPVVAVGTGQYSYTQSRMTLGDALARVRIGLTRPTNNPGCVAFGVGVKFPTGKEADDNGTATGSGSMDVVATLESVGQLEIVRLHANLGFAAPVNEPSDWQDGFSSAFFFGTSIGVQFYPGALATFGVEGYKRQGKEDWGDSYRFTAVPRVEIANPSRTVFIELGFDIDLGGENAVSSLGGILNFTFQVGKD